MTDINTTAAAVLLALGVVAPVPAFMGGLILAMGACFAVMAMRPIGSRKGLVITLLMGILASIIAAILNKGTSHVWLWGNLPLQAQMFAAGAMSQTLFEFIAAKGSSILSFLLGKAGANGDGK